MILNPDGTLAAWGNNRYGQMSAPEDLMEMKAVAAGEYHTVALQSDGKVVAWGRNDSCQTTVPEDLKEVTAIAA